MINNIQEEKTLTMTMLMTPEKANFSGENVHGGEILKMLDHVAYSCAVRYSGCYVVTLSVDMVFFKNPIKIGSLVTFHASVNYVGTTSMEIGIKVISEDIKDRTIKNTNVCYFTMVAVNEAGKGVEIRKLKLNNPDEKRRYASAIKRKESRINLKDKKSTKKI